MMKRSLFICSLWLLLLVIYYFIVGGAVAISLLLLSTVLIVYCIASVTRTSKIITCKINNLSSPVKYEPTTYEIVIESAQKLPALKAKLHICVTHSALNIKQRQIIETVIFSRKTIIPLELSHDYCGRFEVEVTEVEISDMLQIFAKKVGLFISCEAIVKPIIVQKAQFNKLQTIWQQGQAYITTTVHEHGEERAQLKAYQPGDQVKKIHWKLSSKLDDLYVQQFSNPQKQELVLAIDCSRVNGQIETYDKMIEALAALLMLALQGEQIKFVQLQQSWQLQTINTEQQIAHTLQTVLTKSIEQLSLSTTEHNQLIQQYSNVYLITPENCTHMKIIEQMRRA